MSYGSSTSSQKPWRWERLDLTFSMWYIYINSKLNPLTKFSSSSRSTKFPWNISQMIMKTIPISMGIVISYVMKFGIPSGIWWKVNRNWDHNMNRIFQWRESDWRTNTSSEERDKSKRAGLWELQPGIRVGKLTIWIRSFEIITEFIRLISSTRIGKPVLIINVEVSKDKNISRWVDWENPIYVRWNRIKNCTQRWRMRLIEEIKVRHWVE